MAIRIVAPTTTNTPNDLFDHWLPLLSHAELKIILVVIRKTFGWHKHRDRMSLSQLEKFTNLSRRHIIKAANSLMQKGLIIKEVVGKIGCQETYYELVVFEENSDKNEPPPQEKQQNSNNSYQCPKDTGGGGKKTRGGVTFCHPQKKDINKLKKKEEESAPASPHLSAELLISRRPNVATTDEEHQTLIATHGSMIVECCYDYLSEWKRTKTQKELNRATDFSRIMKWVATTLREVDIKERELAQRERRLKNIDDKLNSLESSKQDADKNKSTAEKLEILFAQNRIANYAVEAHEDELIFVMPDGKGYRISYNLSHEEFLKKCQPALNKLKLII